MVAMARAAKLWHGQLSYGTGSYSLCGRACWYEGVLHALDARLGA